MRHSIPFHLVDIGKRIQKAVNFKNQLDVPLSYSQAWAILIIGARKEITQAEIASSLHLEAATVVAIIDGLEKGGFVKRQSATNDRRKYHILLTEKGKNIYILIKKRIIKLDQFLQEKISPKEAENLHQTLAKLFLAIASWKGGEI